MINQKRLLKQFLKLASIKSPSHHEGKIMRCLAGELKALGLRPCFDRTGNLFCSVAGRSGLPRLLLNAHVDTVEPVDPALPRQKGNFLKGSGRGVFGADDKAGVAVILEVLQVLKEKQIAHGELQIIFTVAEEVGLAGAKAIARSRFKAKWGVALDGGRAEEVICQAPSQKNFEVEVIGKAAHAGIHPEQGINAIYVSSRAIAAVKKLGRVDRETTCNIGLVKGGHATNIVPEHSWVKGEVRSHHPQKLERQLSHIKDCFLQAVEHHRGRLKFRVTPVYRAFKIPPAAPFLQRVKRAAARLGFSPIFKSSGGGSDANVFNAAGIPTVVLGVGMEQVHTRKERLNLVEFARGAEFLLQIIKEVGGSREQV